MIKINMAELRLRTKTRYHPVDRPTEKKPLSMHTIQKMTVLVFPCIVHHSRQPLNQRVAMTRFPQKQSGIHQKDYLSTTSTFPTVVTVGSLLEMFTSITSQNDAKSNFRNVLVQWMIMGPRVSGITQNVWPEIEMWPKIAESGNKALVKVRKLARKLARWPTMIFRMQKQIVISHS